MKNIILIILLISITNIVNGQMPLIARVSSAGLTTIYTDFKTAIWESNDDDIIYLPGSAFNIDSISINKRIHIIGTGHYPDSTSVTGRTIFNFTIYFLSGSNGASIQGIKASAITFDGLDSSSITISKCYIGGFIIPWGNNHSINTTINIKESLIYFLHGAADVKYNIENCIFLGNNQAVFAPGAGNVTYCINSLNNSIIKNCLFPFENASITMANTSITNCVFFTRAFNQFAYFGVINDLSTCTFNYNLITISDTIPVFGAGMELGNLAEATLGNTFINVQSQGFNYANNYWLKSTSVGNSISGGVGIYSGTTPYNPNPYNPHIYFKSIAPATNAQGQLQIEVKVKAY